MSNIDKHVLDKCATCFTSARRSLLEGAKLLLEIKEKEVWAERHDSFSEYLSDVCQISDGFASKLIKVYEHYVLGAKLPPQDLEVVDSEKLYLAINIPSDPHEQFQRALTLTRSELQDEVRESKHGVCNCAEHEHIKICTGCRKRVL